MTRAFVLTLAVCTALTGTAFASLESPPASMPAAPVSAPDGRPDVEVGPIGVSRILKTGEPDRLVEALPGPGVREDESSIPLTPFVDWGNDVLVAEPAGSLTFGKISVDVAPNGDIYAAIVNRYQAGRDTLYMFVSTNGGTSWGEHARVIADTLKDFCLRVGSDGGGTWIYTFISYNLGITVRRLRPDTSAFNWIVIADGDSWSRVSADRNIEATQHLFCAYESQGGHMRMKSSADAAATWGNERFLATVCANPSVAAGGDGYVYVSFLPRAESTFHWVGRYTNNLISPSFVWNRPDSVATHRFREVSVAAARTAPGGSQTAIILNTYRFTGNDNIGPRYSWTTNGGVSWTSSFWPPTNVTRETWLATGPYIRNPYGSASFRAVVTMPENTTSFDSIVYAMATPAAPTNWLNRDVHNDYRATGEFGAQVDNSSKTSGGFIVYRQFATRRVWFDGYNFTGVEEGAKPEPVAGRVALPFGRNEVRFSLDQPTPVRATVYDGTGREVGLVHDGTLGAGEHRLTVPTAGLAHGIYFINVDIAGARQTAKLVLAD